MYVRGTREKVLKTSVICVMRTAMLCFMLQRYNFFSFFATKSRKNYYLTALFFELLFL